MASVSRAKKIRRAIDNSLEHPSTLKVEDVDTVGLLDHFHGKSEKRNFPGIIDTFDDRIEWIIGSRDLLDDPITDFRNGIMDDTFLNIPLPEIEAVFQESSRSLLTPQPVGKPFGLLSETLEAESVEILRTHNEGPGGLNISPPNPNFVDTIHQFADEMEFKHSRSKRVNTTIWL